MRYALGDKHTEDSLAESDTTHTRPAGSGGEGEGGGVGVPRRISSCCTDPYHCRVPRFMSQIGDKNLYKKRGKGGISRNYNQTDKAGVAPKPPSPRRIHKKAGRGEPRGDYTRIVHRGAQEGGNVRLGCWYTESWSHAGRGGERGAYSGPEGSGENAPSRNGGAPLAAPRVRALGLGWGSLPILPAGGPMEHRRKG